MDDAVRHRVITAVLGLAIGILTAALSVAAAPGGASGATPSGPPADYKLDDVTIELERTGCLGSCPSYRIAIHGTGDCTYSEGQFGVFEGPQFQMAKEIIVGLLNDLYASDFFVRSDQYTSRVMFRLKSDGRLQQYVETRPDDLVLTVHILDYTKTVGMSAVFAPRELLAFGAKIDSVTNSSQWIKAPSR